VEQTLRAGWALSPVHPTGHVYAKMALNLIEKVAVPARKAETRKRKRSEDTGSGSGSHYGPTTPEARTSRQGEPSRDLSRDRFREPGFNRSHTNSQYGSAPADNRRFTSSNISHQYRGRAGSVSSRGTSGVGGFSEDTGRGQNYRGFRGGFKNRGLSRGRTWPRW
jgi:hypothetical protein